MSRKIVTVYLDTIGNRPLISSTVLQQAETPSVSAIEEVIFRVHLLERDTDEAPAYRTDVPADAVMTVTYKDDFDSTTKVYCQTNDNECNLSADWSEVSPETGKICFRMNFDTQELANALSSTAGMSGRIEIQIWNAGYTQVYHTFWFSTTAVNVQYRRTFVDLTPTTHFDTTAPSTSTITLSYATDDLSDYIQTGACIKVVDTSGNTYYGLAASVLPDPNATLLTITFNNGETLPTGAAEIASVSYEEFPLPIPRTYYTLDQITALLAAYMESTTTEDLVITDSSKGIVLTLSGHTYRVNAVSDGGVVVLQLEQVP